MRLAVAPTALLSVFLALALDAPSAVAACRLVQVEGPQNRVRFSAENADLILIGVVVSEQPSRNSNATKGMFDSRVIPEAVLKGEVTSETLELKELNNRSDCVESPRLEQGERVLLMLGWSYTGGKSDQYDWRISPIAGKIVLQDDGSAFLDEIRDEDDGPIGRSNEIIYDVAQVSNADGREIGAAIAAASRNASARTDGWDLVVLATLILLIGGALLLSYRRRETS